MILLWGLFEDTPLRLVYNHLCKNNENVILINQRYLNEYGFEYNFIDKKITGYITFKEIKIPIEEIKSIYLRPQNVFEIDTLLDIDRNSNEWRGIIAFEQFLYFISDILPITVINKPSAMLSNNSKPYQAKIISSIGFLTPKTVVINKKKYLNDFLIAHNEVIYKSISSIRSIVDKITEVQTKKLRALKYLPTQFQEYIEGEDYRVHVVGNKLFPCKIISNGVDYRYSHDTSIIEVELPEEISKKCFNLVKELGLSIGGIDLRYNSITNLWYCFEVNPSPGFSYYENATEQPISLEICRLLSQ